jgi:ribosome-associated translation inhibitor RaiA
MTEPAALVRVQVTTRGKVPDRLRNRVLAKVEHVLPLSHAPVLYAHLMVACEPDPARERPAHVEVSLDVNGVPVRAHVAASNLDDAADQLENRLRRRLVQMQDRSRTRHRWIGVSGEQEWQHGDLPRRPVPYYPRPVEARRIVRRKTFALEAMTPDEAAYEMDLLDHDFYLFIDLETGADAFIHRRPEGGYGFSGQIGRRESEETVASLVVEGSPPTLSEAQARERLDVGGERHVFYLEEVDGRGRVLYRRYDGHYGLIRP